MGLDHHRGTASVGATIASASECLYTLTSSGGSPPLDLRVRVISKLDPALRPARPLVRVPVRRDRLALSSSSAAIAARVRPAGGISFA